MKKNKKVTLLGLWQIDKRLFNKYLQMNFAVGL